jgi:hypothetical protein
MRSRTAANRNQHRAILSAVTTLVRVRHTPLSALRDRVPSDDRREFADRIAPLQSEREL